MENKIKELEDLGAKVKLNKDGLLTLDGNWNKKYNDYHELFSEIDGILYINSVEQDKDFLKDLKSLGGLYTPFVKQDKDFLKDLKSLGTLNTYDIKQDKDFLKDLKSLGTLQTSYATQDKDFLKDLKSLGTLDTSYIKQDKDFLKNLKSLGILYTYDIKHDKNFLKDLKSLGILQTSRVEQDKDFLKNASNEFELPYIYLDGILSEVISTKKIDGITVYNTKRVGYLDTEYVVTDGVFNAHGKSIKMALIDLRFKKSDRDTEYLRELNVDSVLKFEDGLLAYRLITGACIGGIEVFLNSIEEKDEYKVSEIIELTRGYYGSEEFKEFFSN